MKNKIPFKTRFNIWLHKERRAPSILQIAIVVFVIAMVVSFFVWPSMFWFIATALGSMLPVISLILVVRLWVIRERKKAEGE